MVKKPPPRTASRSREATRPDKRRIPSNSLGPMISFAIKKGYSLSVDDRKSLVVYQSRDPLELRKNMRTHRDLVWLYDKTGFKFGWMQVNSLTGEVLDYSKTDKRTIELIASEFLG
jgi:hypothetical protein